MKILEQVNKLLPYFKKPSETDLKIIKQMFEESVDGKPYDTERFGAYYRPAGVSAPQGSTKTTSSPTATSSPAPVVTTQPVAETTTEEVSTPEPKPATKAKATVETTSAKKADDILAMIRERQK